ncbi:YncE family protein [Rhodopila sp.]|uniref:YncE family protein n=1 Tax=Rhodopila sp. TaxID=2480087 RepID=UPI002B68CB5E|nr:PQQ-binding-like beta-propeller repeat protein [Rhodopila sp.]HVZ06317.1 PQQ-binding-like beta-propeller repeat protein [Rhodopila sp.]
MQRAMSLFCRASFAAALLAVPLTMAAASAHAAGIAFVINSRGPSISIVDMTTKKEIGRIPALREPHHLMLSPDGRSLLVGDTSGNQMMFLDPNTGEVRKRLPMADPYQFAFSPDGRFFVVNGLARNQVDVYDGRTFALIKRFPVVATPSHLAFSPDSKWVFVSLQDSDKLVSFDLDTMTERWSLPVGKTPAGVLWLNNEVLVADMGTDYVARVDPHTGKVIGTIVTAKGAHNLFLSPDRKILWVNNREGGSTTAVDAASLKVMRTYKLSGGPDDLDFAPNGRLWLTRRFAQSVAILDPATGEIQIIDVGRSPHGIWLNPKAPTPAQVSSR